MALPLAFYLIPLWLGFAWNNAAGPNIVQLKEIYAGRLYSLPITIDPWQTGKDLAPVTAILKYSFQVPSGIYWLRTH